MPATGGKPAHVFPASSEMWIAFVPFKVHITFHEGQRLTVNVVDGENADFSDTVESRCARGSWYYRGKSTSAAPLYTCSTLHRTTLSHT
jgi:hypothetical protein